MRRIFTWMIFFPLFSMGSVLFSSLMSLGETTEQLTDERPQSHARARQLNVNIQEILQNWVQGSHAVEDGNPLDAEAYFERNVKHIEAISSRSASRDALKDYQQCFLSFNAVLLQSVTENASPNFLSVESDCFNRVILLLSNYSASGDR